MLLSDSLARSQAFAIFHNLPVILKLHRPTLYGIIHFPIPLSGRSKAEHSSAQLSAAPNGLPRIFVWDGQAMKAIASEQQIAAEIQRRITVSTFANGYCAKCTAPKPYRIKNDGCANWSADIPATELRGCEGFVLSIVASVRHDHDPAAQSTPEVVRHLYRSRNQPF